MKDIKENGFLELSDEELEKVSGGNSSGNPFEGLSPGDIYQSKSDPTKYIKIGVVNNNGNGVVDYFRGEGRGNYIVQTYPTGYDTPSVIKRDYNTSVKIGLEWKVGLLI